MTSDWRRYILCPTSREAVTFAGSCFCLLKKGLWKWQKAGRSRTFIFFFPVATLSLHLHLTCVLTIPAFRCGLAKVVAIQLHCVVRAFTPCIARCFLLKIPGQIFHGNPKCGKRFCACRVFDRLCTHRAQYVHSKHSQSLIIWIQHVAVRVHKTNIHTNGERKQHAVNTHKHTHNVMLIWQLCTNSQTVKRKKPWHVHNTRAHTNARVTLRQKYLITST